MLGYFSSKYQVIISKMEKPKPNVIKEAILESVEILKDKKVGIRIVQTR